MTLSQQREATTSANEVGYDTWRAPRTRRAWSTVAMGVLLLFVGACGDKFTPDPNTCGQEEIYCKLVVACCAGLECVDGTCHRPGLGDGCATSSECMTGLACSRMSPGKCVVAMNLALGQPCESDTQCNSGTCHDGSFCSQPCPDGGACSSDTTCVTYTGREADALCAPSCTLPSGGATNCARFDAEAATFTCQSVGNSTDVGACAP